MPLLAKEVVLLQQAATYGDVCRVALERMSVQAEFAGKAGLGMVCGPISTGGLGTIEANLGRFALAIDGLQARGYHVFSQMPYETALHRIRDAAVGHGTYDMNLLEEFYLPLFESGYVRRKFFIPGWQTSKGTTWERNHAIRLGIEIIDLSEFLVPV